jgi:hypothetical protein
MSDLIGLTLEEELAYLEQYEKFVDSLDHNYLREKYNGLTPKQQSIWYDDSRFRVLCCGRRSGKSLLAINELIRAAQTGYKKNVWYVSPTYKMSKRIAWKLLKEAIPSKNILSKNEQDLEIIIRGYESVISLKGCEDEDALRGDSLDFLVMDEVQDIKMSAFDTVLSPSLTDRKGDGLFLGTPKGMGNNTMYQFYMRGKTKPFWKSWRFTTAEAGIVDLSEIEMFKQTMPLKIFRQEFEASFESAAGRVYYAFDREFNVSEKARDLGGILHVGIDFNVDPMSACIASHTKDEQGRDIVYVFDEIVIPDSNTYELANTLKKRYPGRKIICYPDPSGKGRSTKAIGGVTDHSILKSEPFKWSVVAPSKAPAVADRVNNVNAMWESADGSRRMFVHPRCEEVIKCVDGQLYKPGTNDPDKRQGYDHMVDALGYMVCSVSPLIKRTVRELQLDWSY